MSIASVSNRWLNRLYKIVAILLVLLAVLISALRLFSPYVDHYRQDFQDYLNTNNQTNLVIGGLGMNWQRSGPTLIASRVTLVDTTGAYVYVKHLEIQVDFWATLTTQQLISSNLILDGAVVTLDQHSLDIASKDKTESEQSNGENKGQLDGIKRIAEIFLNRINRFSLFNSKISIKNKELDRRFRINNLQWLNRGERHRAQGNITVDEISSNNLSLKIDINGRSIDELDGMMYIEANHLDITPWLDSVLTLENDKTKADIGFSAWLKVDKGSIERLQVSLHDNLISWEENISVNTSQVQPSQNITQGSQSLHSTVRHNLTLSAGQLFLVKGQNTETFKLFSTPLSFQFDQKEAKEFTVQIHKTPEDALIYLSSFDLALISQLSPLLITSKKNRKILSELNISGESTDIFIRQANEELAAFAHFTGVSTQYSQGVPGIENLAGSLSYAQQHLHLDVVAKQGHIDFKQHFVAPMPYELLQSTIGLTMKENGWQLKVNDLALNSDELSLQANLAIDAPVNAEMQMSLLANIINGDASKAGHYYPLTTMSKNLVDYLNGALIDGEIKQAQVLINGPLAKFPFEDKSGTFIVDAELVQSTFRFSEDWPEIDQFDANLNFTNNSMLITGRSGSLSGLNVAGVQAAIDDLGHEASLTIDTLIHASSTDNIAKLMNNSPLKNSVGVVLQRLQVKGDIQGEFHLDLPLEDTDKALAQGEINFVDNTVLLQAPSMVFKQVNGQLRFENDKITTSNLAVKWQGLPISLTVKAIDKTNYYDTNILLDAQWKQASWMPHLPPSFKKYVNGQLNLQGDLSLYQHHGGGFSYQLDIGTDLKQVQLKLPKPYTKQTNTKAPLRIEVKGQLQQSTFNASLGDKLSFFGVLDHETSHFDRAHIVLGNEKMLLPMDGLHITTNLTSVNFNEWQPLILDIIDTTANKELNSQPKNNALFSSPDRIRGTIGTLDLLGQNWHNVSFNLLDKTHWWLLQLNAKETRSQIKIYPDWLEQGIDINADFIHIVKQPSTEGEHTTKDLNADLTSKQTSDKNEARQKTVIPAFDEALFASIPKLNFFCERCQVDNLNLGEVSFSIRRSDDDIIKIENFKAKREQAEFTFSGQWQKPVTYTEQSSTSINGSLSLKNIEYELEQLGYGSIIRDSGGKLDFNVNWPGGPHDFSFEHLNGEVSANIDDGYLAEVSDKARIFSVLSLQSIVRKLTLDFRDIFSEGMFYKDIKGDYRINEGVLYTDNTRMNGSAGNLFVQGNTSFVDSTLDYHMTYKPNLTSSLPVLAWIATLNPLGFLAGVAIDQVITSQVVSEFNFELTGSVNDPNFKEVNRKSRDISVGRSKPPEFVDTSDKTNENIQENKNKPFKDFKENPFKEN